MAPYHRGRRGLDAIHALEEGERAREVVVVSFEHALQERIVSAVRHVARQDDVVERPAPPGNAAFGPREYPRLPHEQAAVRDVLARVARVNQLELLVVAFRGMRALGFALDVT